MITEIIKLLQEVLKLGNFEYERDEFYVVRYNSVLTVFLNDCEILYYTNEFINNKNSIFEHSFYYEILLSSNPTSITVNDKEYINITDDELFQLNITNPEDINLYFQIKNIRMDDCLVDIDLRNINYIHKFFNEVLNENRTRNI